MAYIESSKCTAQYPPLLPNVSPALVVRRVADVPGYGDNRGYNVIVRLFVKND